MSHKENGNTIAADTHDGQQESLERNTSPSADSFPVYSLPKKDMKHAKISKSTIANTDNIPEYALPNKDKENSEKPVHSLPNKGKKTINTSGAQAGHFEEPEEAYSYSPVTFRPPKEDRQPVMDGANGNEEAEWMGISICNTRAEYEGAHETEGWKDNTIYDTREDYAASHETEGWNDNSIYTTWNQ